MADTIPPVLIELQLETAKIAAQMQELTGNFANFGKVVEKQGGFLEKFKATASGVFAGNLMVTGLNMIKGAIGGAIQDAQQYEVLLKQTAAVIASTGNAAGISVASLKAHASQLESIATVDENVILHGENVIATFTNIRNVAGQGNDVFDQTTKAALDLSAALGQDMQSSSIQLGKALNDPIKGLTALTRVGVTFDEGQKKAIATMQNAGNTMGAQKIILAEINKEFGGAAKAAGDTFAGAVFRAKDKVADFGRDLVTNLQPVLLNIGKIIGSIYEDTLKPLLKIIGDNKEALALFVGVLGAAYVAFKVYNGIMEVAKAVQTAYKVGQVLMSGGQLASIASTNGLAASMLRLNAIMDANPIGLIVAGIALLAAGFVIAWNHSETFRKVVVKGLQIVLDGVGYLIGGFAKMIGLFAKIPGMGWAKGIADGASKAANDIRKVSDGLDNLANKKINIPGFGGGKTADTGKTGGAAAPDAGKSIAAIKAAVAAAKAHAKEIAAAGVKVAKAAVAAAKAHAKAVETVNKEVVKIYDEMHKAIDEGHKKANEAAAKRDALVIETKEKYAAKELDITKKKDEELTKNTTEWNKAYTKAHEEAAKRNAIIDADYAKKQIALHDAANDKILAAEENAATKRASIIQTSIDRLRSAFASGTAATITDIFKSGATSADAMITELKNKLNGAKELQKSAAELQAAGYSQVFIEDVVKNGPEVGNQMAKALLGANADTQTQLKSLYAEVNSTSAHGMDAVAHTMNSGGKLATEELLKQFAEVTVDLNKTLAIINRDLLDSLALANEDYKDKLASSKEKLNDALKAADEKLAEANTATMKQFREALAKNATDLADALAQVQQNYDDAIANIAANTKDRLDALNVQLQATIQKLKDLGEAQQAAAATAYNPVTYVPPVSQKTGEGDSKKATSAMDKKDGGNTYNYNVSGYNLSDPAATAKALDATVKFGTPQSITASNYRLQDR